MTHDNSPNRKIVLVVEDSPTQAINLQGVLVEAGLEVVCAVDGAMGLRLARQIKPHLIIMDVQMPEMNGFQVAEALKGDTSTSDIPIIMFTRNDAPEAIQLGLSSGALDYIPKDAFATAVLLETIRQMGLIES